MRFILVLLFTFPLFSKDIQITISKVDVNLGGELRVSLFNSEKEFPKGEVFKREVVSADNETKIVIFKNLPDGDYAVSLCHDENSNGKIDKNFLGLPTEGYGISNKAKPFFGPPPFEKAKFSGESDSIEMNY